MDTPSHTSVDRSALQHYFDLVWVCCGPCSYNDAAVDKILFDIACRSVYAVEELLGYSWYRGNVHAAARTTRSLVVIKVDRSTSSQYCTSAFSAVSSRFFATFFFWEKVNGCRVILL